MRTRVCAIAIADLDFIAKPAEGFVYQIAVSQTLAAWETVDRQILHALRASRVKRLKAFGCVYLEAFPIPML